MFVKWCCCLRYGGKMFWRLKDERWKSEEEKWKSEDQVR